MILEKEHTLQPDEIKEMIKEGHNISDSGNKMYVMRFLFNDKMNKATDPKPFRVKTEILDKLREDAIGMPWVVPEYGQNKHIRGKYDNPNDEVSSLLELQKKYSIGEIIGTMRFPSNNVWGIIDVWPEFQAAVEREYIPPLVSPTLNIISEDEDGIAEAQFINLQSVPSSGYPAELTYHHTLCKNNLKECMAEMRVAGAAGIVKTFSNTKSVNPKSMSEQPTESTAPSIEEVAKAVVELKAEVDKLKAAIVETAKEAEGADENKIEEIVNTGSSEGSSEEPKVEGASGKATLQMQLQKMQSELEKVKKNDAENTKLVAQFKREREQAQNALKRTHAESIVERKTRGQSLSQEAKEKLVAEYASKDITLLEELDNELKSAIPASSENSTIKGAYGYYSSDFTAKADRPKNSELMEVTS